MPRGDVDEVTADALAGERELEGPGGVPVVIARDDLQGRAELFEFDQRFRLADISEMPDLVRRAKQARQARRVTVVGIGKDGDAHSCP